MWKAGRIQRKLSICMNSRRYDRVLRGTDRRAERTAATLVYCEDHKDVEGKGNILLLKKIYIKLIFNLHLEANRWIFTVL